MLPIHLDSATSTSSTSRRTNEIQDGVGGQTNNRGQDASRTEEQRAVRRPRRILLPLDTELTNASVMRRIREFLLNDLIGDKVFGMNLNRNHIDVQLICIITPRLDQKAHIYYI